MKKKGIIEACGRGDWEDDLLVTRGKPQFLSSTGIHWVTLELDIMLEHKPYGLMERLEDQ